MPPPVGTAEERRMMGSGPLEQEAGGLELLELYRESKGNYLNEQEVGFYLGTEDKR